jgi:hypothetical protein
MSKIYRVRVSVSLMMTVTGRSEAEASNAAESVAWDIFGAGTLSANKSQRNAPVYDFVDAPPIVVSGVMCEIRPERSAT